MEANEPLSAIVSNPIPHFLLLTICNNEPIYVTKVVYLVLIKSIYLLLNDRT